MFKISRKNQRVIIFFILTFILFSFTACNTRPRRVQVTSNPREDNTIPRIYESHLAWRSINKDSPSDSWVKYYNLETPEIPPITVGGGFGGLYDISISSKLISWQQQAPSMRDFKVCSYNIDTEQKWCSEWMDLGITSRGPGFQGPVVVEDLVVWGRYNQVFYKKWDSKDILTYNLAPGHLLDIAAGGDKILIGIGSGTTTSSISTISVSDLTIQDNLAQGPRKSGIRVSGDKMMWFSTNALNISVLYVGNIFTNTIDFSIPAYILGTGGTTVNGFDGNRIIYTSYVPASGTTLSNTDVFQFLVGASSPSNLTNSPYNQNAGGLYDNFLVYSNNNISLYGSTQIFIIDLLSRVPAWQNENNSLDVNFDGTVNSLDPQLVQTYLNSKGEGVVPNSTGPTVQGEYFWDVNGDGSITALDVQAFSTM